jgi:hypothetical protein
MHHESGWSRSIEEQEDDVHRKIHMMEKIEVVHDEQATM